MAVVMVVMVVMVVIVVVAIVLMAMLGTRMASAMAVELPLGRAVLVAVVP